jgi:hypothetical protein
MSATSIHLRYWALPRRAFRSINIKNNKEKVYKRERLQDGQPYQSSKPAGKDGSQYLCPSGSRHLAVWSVALRLSKSGKFAKLILIVVQKFGGSRESLSSKMTTYVPSRCHHNLSESVVRQYRGTRYLDGSYEGPRASLNIDRTATLDGYGFWFYMLLQGIWIRRYSKAFPVGDSVNKPGVRRRICLECLGTGREEVMLMFSV